MPNYIESIKGSIQWLYNGVLRDHLPRKLAVYNGVVAREARLLDLNPDVPHYKKGLIDAIYEQVSSGDTVVILGGGRGVSSVHCRLAGADNVIAFEAAEDMIERAVETVSLSHLDGVEFRHALIGNAVNVYGDYNEAEGIDPGELPLCDVLIMDVEGAELSIIPEMPIVPTVIVETHPEEDAPTDKVAKLLKQRGYEISIRESEPDNKREKNVIVGTKW